MGFICLPANYPCFLACWTISVLVHELVFISTSTWNREQAPDGGPEIVFSNATSSTTRTINPLPWIQQPKWRSNFATQHLGINRWKCTFMLRSKIKASFHHSHTGTFMLRCVFNYWQTKSKERRFQLMTNFYKLRANTREIKLDTSFVFKKTTWHWDSNSFTCLIEKAASSRAS